MLSSGDDYQPALNKRKPVTASILDAFNGERARGRAIWHCLIGWDYAFGVIYIFAHSGVAVVRHNSGEALAFSQSES